jgi:dihydroorotate dehydrogenase
MKLLSYKVVAVVKAVVINFSSQNKNGKRQLANASKSWISSTDELKTLS